MDKSSLGDRMKAYEGATNLKMMPLVPIMARLDGKTFSKYTKGMRKPYDGQLARVMVSTMHYLVEKTEAVVGYTQSDEIQLCWHTTRYESQRWYDGKHSKMVSVLASMASSVFNLHAEWECLVPRNKSIPAFEMRGGNWKPLTKRGIQELALFDCRVWSVPNTTEATNTFIWREQDAVRNSISGAAQSEFSHKQLMNKSCKQMQEMLFSERYINWNDYPNFFKRGTFALRRKVFKPLSQEQLERIPEKHRPIGPVERQEVQLWNDIPLCRVANRVEFLFQNADPVKSEET